MLSIKGREPFIRMQLWLSDPHNIEKLQAIKTDSRDGIKRKRVGGAGSGSGFDSSSDRSSPVDPGDLSYSADSPGSAKKQRMLFTDEQKEALKVAFALDPYPSTSVIEFLSQDLSLESRNVSNWFHNHRMRLKQQPTPENLAALAMREGAAGTFDPVKYKLLCHQRIMEMAKEGAKDDAIQHPSNSVTSFLRQLGLPTVGAALTGVANKGEGGLDLSFKREGDEADSIAASSEGDDDDAKATSAAAVAAAVAAAANSSRSSRRKQAAPQWVRAEFAKQQQQQQNEDGKDATINGVCVMNSSISKDAAEEEESAQDADVEVAEEASSPKNNEEEPLSVNE